jgi:hypothetical protein
LNIPPEGGVVGVSDPIQDFVHTQSGAFKERPARLDAQLLQKRFARYFKERTGDSAHRPAWCNRFAGELLPGVERLVLFHVVAEGRCWIALADGPCVWLERGDIVVLPYGDMHTMGSDNGGEPEPVAKGACVPAWRSCSSWKCCVGIWPRCRERLSAGWAHGTTRRWVAPFGCCMQILPSDGPWTASRATSERRARSWPRASRRCSASRRCVT